MKKSEVPWTWKEIANLDADGRAQLIADYGDRAKAALVAADHPPGAHKDMPACNLIKFPRLWTCDECPLDTVTGRNTWRVVPGEACTEAAMATYAIMVAKLGLLPGGE